MKACLIKWLGIDLDENIDNVGVNPDLQPVHLNPSSFEVVLRVPHSPIPFRIQLGMN
jgi:hypothetical protein